MKEEIETKKEKVFKGIVPHSFKRGVKGDLIPLSDSPMTFYYFKLMGMSSRDMEKATDEMRSHAHFGKLIREGKEQFEKDWGLMFLILMKLFENEGIDIILNYKPKEKPSSIQEKENGNNI